MVTVAFVVAQRLVVEASRLLTQLGFELTLYAHCKDPVDVGFRFSLFITAIVARSGGAPLRIMSSSVETLLSWLICSSRSQTNVASALIP